MEELFYLQDSRGYVGNTMNSKQRRQEKRKLLRIVNELTDAVEEMLTEIIDGKNTVEYFAERVAIPLQQWLVKRLR